MAEYLNIERSALSRELSYIYKLVKLIVEKAKNKRRPSSKD